MSRESLEGKMNHIFWMHKRLGETVQSSLRNFANLLGNTTTRKDPDSFLVEQSSWAQFPPAWQMSSRKMEGAVGRCARGGGGGSILRSPSTFCASYRSGVHVSTLWKAGFSFFRVLSPFFSMGFLHERLCGGEITIFSFNFSSPPVGKRRVTWLASGQLILGCFSFHRW